MPAAALAVQVTRSLPNKGIAHMLSNDSTRLSLKPAFSRRVSSVKTHATGRFQGLFPITPRSYISLENSVSYLYEF